VSLPQRIQEILASIAKSGRLASAYIFFGPPGSGKKEAAHDFAEILGCHKQDKFLIEPEKTSIKIEQVRELQGWVRYGPSASPYLLAIVDQADKLTEQAAAAFLKTLEEPPPGVVFVLLVEREDKLPATICSRSQKILFAEKIEKWQKNPERDPFYQELKNIHRKTKSGGLLKLSVALAKEKENIEALLYDLSYFARYELRNTQYARIILDSLRYIKRRANLKLALDTMCLKLALGSEPGLVAAKVDG